MWSSKSFTQHTKHAQTPAGFFFVRSVCVAFHRRQLEHIWQQRRTKQMKSIRITSRSSDQMNGEAMEVRGQPLRIVCFGKTLLCCHWLIHFYVSGNKDESLNSLSTITFHLDGCEDEIKNSEASDASHLQVTGWDTERFKRSLQRSIQHQLQNVFTVITNQQFLSTQKCVRLKFGPGQTFILSLRLTEIS